MTEENEVIFMEECEISSEFLEEEGTPTPRKGNLCGYSCNNGKVCGFGCY